MQKSKASQLAEIKCKEKTEPKKVPKSTLICSRVQAVQLIDVYNLSLLKAKLQKIIIIKWNVRKTLICKYLIDSQINYRTTRRPRFDRTDTWTNLQVYVVTVSRICNSCNIFVTIANRMLIPCSLRTKISAQQSGFNFNIASIEIASPDSERFFLYRCCCLSFWY